MTYKRHEASRIKLPWYGDKMETETKQPPSEFTEVPHDAEKRQEWKRREGICWRCVSTTSWRFYLSKFRTCVSWLSNGYVSDVHWLFQVVPTLAADRPCERLLCLCSMAGRKAHKLGNRPSVKSLG